MYSRTNESYYEILELEPGASPREIRRAYLELKELYSGNSIATLPISEEFPEETKARILFEIEEAYEKLSARSGDDAIRPRREAEAYLPPSNGSPETREGVSSYDGGTLRRVREETGVDLFDIARATMIPVKTLRDIEMERFAELPAEVYVRGFLTAYARYLSLDPDRVVSDYVIRMWAEKQPPRAKKRGSLLKRI